MDLGAFTKFEWHDLPVLRMCFSASGIDLVVTPYNEATAAYDRFRLTLRGASSVRLGVQGELSPRDWSDLQVSSFDYRAGDDRRLSGTLGILPGSAGFWTITFVNAQWELEQLPSVDPDAAE